MEEKPTRIIYGTYIENQINNYDIHDNTIHGGNFYLAEQTKKGENEGDKGRKTEEGEVQILSFEEAIPEELRIGQMFGVWVKLKKKGILDENYRLAPGIPHTAANYLVTCFCTEGNCKWKPFEQFWGIDKLKDKKGEFRIDLKDKINSIFAKH